ncbi:LysE family translocator [Phreatobacter stygius]|uniref:LysE family translocator n=2 Tax=Phreatobacter stygius TaxID=1940610 RepID=A0A4D7B7H0_9HYPH|nr:LysE family translocator [Phreatobacter stygius]
MEQVQQIALVYAAYVIATASPGPSNMAIMGVAMSRGRVPALVLAAGVISGSIFWAGLAATGISAILASYANALTAIKIAGGLYLIYLGWKSARAAFSASKPAAVAEPAAGRPDFGRLYRRGLLMHLSNPKAVLAWIAIMSLGLKPDAPSSTLPMIVGGCALLGIVVFGGYALAFSTRPMVRLYQRARRGIEGTLALFFGLAGVRLLMSR